MWNAEGKMRNGNLPDNLPDEASPADTTQPLYDTIRDAILTCARDEFTLEVPIGITV